MFAWEAIVVIGIATFLLGFGLGCKCGSLDQNMKAWHRGWTAGFTTGCTLPDARFIGDERPDGSW